MERQADRDRIAEEAVGQRHESAPPYAGTKPDMSQEEAARQFAAASGAEASTSEKTAESMGERVGDAYSDPESVRRHSARKLGSANRSAGRVSQRRRHQPLPLHPGGSSRGCITSIQSRAL